MALVLPYYTRVCRHSPLDTLPMKFWQNSKQFLCKEHFPSSNIDWVRAIWNLKEIHENTLIKNLWICLKSYKFKFGRKNITPKHVHVCFICEKVCCTGKLLSGHINEFHKFSCPICNQSFTLKHNLERHVGNRFAVTCKDCGKVFCNYKAYSEHEDIHHVKSVIWDIINALAKFFLSDI